MWYNIMYGEFFSVPTLILSDMPSMPQLTLTKNGIVVANLCCARPFVFDNQQKLPACDEDRVNRLRPTVVKRVVLGAKGERHIFFDTHVSENFIKAVRALDKPVNEHIDYVLVSQRVFTAMKRDEIWHPKIRLAARVGSNLTGPIWDSNTFHIDSFEPELAEKYEEVPSTWEQIHGLYKFVKAYLSRNSPPP